MPEVDVAILVGFHRRHLVTMMQRYTRIKENAPETDVGLLLVADAEIYRLDALIRWLDAADARIRRFPMPVAAAPPMATRTRRQSMAPRFPPHSSASASRSSAAR